MKTLEENLHYKVLPEPKYNWIWYDSSGVYGVPSKDRPNTWYRFWQRVLLGFRWEKVK